MSHRETPAAAPEQARFTWMPSLRAYLRVLADLGAGLNPDSMSGSQIPADRLLGEVDTLLTEHAALTAELAAVTRAYVECHEIAMMYAAMYHERTTGTSSTLTAEQWQAGARHVAADLSTWDIVRRGLPLPTTPLPADPPDPPTPVVIGNAATGCNPPTPDAPQAIAAETAANANSAEPGCSGADKATPEQPADQQLVDDLTAIAQALDRFAEHFADNRLPGSSECAQSAADILRSHIDRLTPEQPVFRCICERSDYGGILCGCNKCEACCTEGCYVTEPEQPAEADGVCETCRGRLYDPRNAPRLCPDCHGTGGKRTAREGE